MQYNIFDSLYPEYKSKKTTRIIELFGGIGSQSKALERLGVPFEPWKLVEIDKFACQAYNAIHGTNFTTSDIMELHGKDLSVVDGENYDYIMTWSFPCYSSKTLVNTRRGLIPIKDVMVGDFVLTHDGTWQKVEWSGKTGEKELYSVNAMCVPPDTKLTINHPLYIRKKFKDLNGNTFFSNPEFISCGQLNCDTDDIYCGIKVNSESIIPSWPGIDLKMGSTRFEHRDTINKFIANPDFWWIVGKYVADGWHRPQGGIVIACGWPNGREDLRGVTTSALLEKFNNIGVHTTVAHEKTCDKVHVTYKEWEEFLSPIGRKAHNKKLPQFILDLPEFLLRSFVDGYLAGDGHFNVNSGYWSGASVSRELAIGMSQAIMKAYHVGVSVAERTYAEGSKCIIEGREVNHRPYWSYSFGLNKKSNRWFYEDGYIWYKLYSIEPSGEIADVYDLTVENSHSFIADNIISHNCTSLSLAGLRQGMEENSGTASSLIWEVRRLLKEMNELKGTKSEDGKEYCLPKILLMENVPQVVDESNVKNLNKMRDFLESLGYSNYLNIMCGADYGVPQARNRAFMVSILGDEENPVYSYQFPDPVKQLWGMKDCLRDDVDSKLNVRTEVASNVCKNNCLNNHIKKDTTQKPLYNYIRLCGRLNNHQAGGVFDPYGVSPTLTAGGAGDVNVLIRKPVDLADSENWKDEPIDAIDFSKLSEEETARELFYESEDLFDEELDDSNLDKEEFKWEPIVRDGVEYYIRRMTACETYQIMDFDESDFKKAALCTSQHQMHKQAGNSIVVNCIVAILGQFYEGKEQVYQEISKIPPKERIGFKAI